MKRKPTQPEHLTFDGSAACLSIQNASSPIDTCVTSYKINSMSLTYVLDPTSQSTHLSYNPQGQLSSVTLPAKLGAPGIPVIKD